MLNNKYLIIIISIVLVISIGVTVVVKPTPLRAKSLKQGSIVRGRKSDEW